MSHFETGFAGKVRRGVEWVRDKIDGRFGYEPGPDKVTLEINKRKQEESEAAAALVEAWVFKKNNPNLGDEQVFARYLECMIN
jgi:hypothetical protein